MKEKRKLRINNSYLIKKYGFVNSITILNITNTAYQIRWNVYLNNEENSIVWKLIEEFHSEYDVFENISDFMVVDKNSPNINSIYDLEVQLISCPTCNGTGSVIDFMSTNGCSKTCPDCFGKKVKFSHKKISKKIFDGNIANVNFDDLDLIY